MSAAQCLMLDTSSFWLNRRQIEDAERDYYVKMSSSGSSAQNQQTGTIASEIAKAREQIRQTLNQKDDCAAASGDAQLVQRIAEVEEENRELRKITSNLQSAIKMLESRIKSLEVSGSKSSGVLPSSTQATSKAAVESDEGSDDDDDFELFGDDDEDDEAKAEAERVRAERLKAYAEKKAKKPQVIAKSNIIFDIKPWDDETDMAEMERRVRKIEKDGLLWGAAKLVPVGYGIKKLQITTVVEDEKVSVDELEEEIVAIEDYIQSVDIAAFNKI